MIKEWPNKFMEPSPADALESACAGSVKAPAWLIICRLGVMARNFFVR